MRLVYGRSPWLDRFPRSRVPSYPKHSGDRDIEVAIVGGGLTGCATAYAFAAAGVKVTLFEADRIGRGTTAHTAGWITDEPASTFGHLDELIGRRAARHAWQAWRRAALDFGALVRRLDLKCHLESRGGLLVAQAEAQVTRLGREHKLRRDAGLEGLLLPARSVGSLTGFPAGSALKTKDSLVVDPYRATIGLAAAAAERGAELFERSPVKKTSFTRHEAVLTVGPRTVRAKRIIIATGRLGELFTPLVRHLTPRSTYLVLTEPVPARVRRGLGSRDHLIRDSAEPPHRISWVDDERVLVGGADSEPVPARSRETVLRQRTGQLMYELSTFYPEISGLRPVYGWDLPLHVTSTGLPIIGPHRNYPHHLFACGGDQSLTGAYLASRVLLRHHMEDTQPVDAAFAFGH